MKHIKKINEFFDDDLAISQEMTKDANAEGALQWEKSLIDKIAEVIDELDGDFSGRQISLSQDDKNHLAEAALRYIRKSAEVLSNDPEVSLTEKKINEIRTLNSEKRHRWAKSDWTVCK